LLWTEILYCRTVGYVAVGSEVKISLIVVVI